MKTFKAVAYARYSSDKQQESSIVVQLAAIHRFCDEHNIELIYEYIDEAQTGTNANRKSFQKMISDAPNGDFQLVIVHRLDRWARNVDDARYYKKYLLRYGIKIISAIEEFDETPEGEFFELMSLGMAELYSKKLSRESIAGKMANARECKAHGGNPPLGYCVKNKHYVIDEKEAECVRIIFDMFVEGYSYHKIRDYLNGNGFKRSDGRPFSLHFYDILRNRKYLGEYIYNRASKKDALGRRNNHKDKESSEIIRIQGGMPQIIDNETFDKAQRILDSKMHGNNRSHLNYGRVHLLTGLIQCKICGHSCFGTSNVGHNVKWQRYQCHKQRVEQCANHGVVVEYLDDYIQMLLYKTLLSTENRESLKVLIKESYLRTADALYDQKQRIENEIDEQRKHINVCIQESMKDKAKIIKQCLDDEILQSSTNIRRLEQDLELIEYDIKAFPSLDMSGVDRNARRIVKILKTGTKDEIRTAIRSIIDRIYLDNDTIDVQVNFGELVNSSLHMGCTIIQDRDKVAICKRHNELDYRFEALTVRM